jgi:hypothetical protein
MRQAPIPVSEASVRNSNGLFRSGVDNEIFLYNFSFRELKEFPASVGMQVETDFLVKSVNG